MKKYSLLFAVLTGLLTLTTNAQNLVLNPSFENTTACPQGISQFSLAVDWGEANSGADSCTTADLYAACTPQWGGSNSPNGLLGYQQSRTGTHHAGAILGDGFPGACTLFDNWRENLEGTLSSPLVAGQKYLVRFYVSLAEGGMGGTDDFDVYFSNSYYSHNACTDPNGPRISVTPQLSYCGPCVMDTVNWKELRWIYTATGGEQYFVVGNFKSNANTTVCALNCGSFNPYLYYYFDDFEVSPAAANDCSFSLTTTTTPAGCANNNGTATVEAVGCNSPFQYHWNTNAVTNAITGLSSGNYTVTVFDNTNCSSTISANVALLTPPTIQFTTINASCTTNNGTVIANATGTGPFTYAWNTGAATQVLNNLGAGTYTVTVTAAGACTVTASATITASAGGLNLTGSSTPATCGNNNGSAAVAVSGGSGNYSYLWSNGQTSASISNLAVGTYSVTVQPNGSTQNTTFYTEDFNAGQGGWTFSDGSGTNGTQPNQWVVNSNTDCSCNTGNYLHVTCNPSSLTCIGNPGACTYFTGSPIPNPLLGDPTADKMAISPAISTVGKSNMVLKFKYAAGGDAGIDYGQLRFSSNGGTTWTDMPTQYTGTGTCTQASVSIPNNFEGIANFKMAFRWINNNDGNGDDPGFTIDSIRIEESASGSCPSVTSVTVSGSNTLSVSAVNTAANCGQNNGTATANVSGTGNYTYTWSNGGTTATISNLTGGTYTVTVNAGGNCTATASTTVPSSGSLTLNTQTADATCGNNNGTATVTVSGTGNYTYAWSNGGNNATISNLSANTYTVTVNEGNCSATATAIVVANAGLSGTFTVTQPSCGQSNGILNCTNITGTPISTIWRLNGTQISTSLQVNNLGAGNYSFHAIDANGCALDTNFVLNSSGSTNPVINANQTSFCSSDSAQICAPVGYAAYLWNTGATVQCITVKQAGNYYVTVTDNGNCTAASNHLAINVLPAPPVSISVNGDTLVAYNAQTYQWYLNGVLIPGANTAQWIATTTGSYTVVVSGTNGCTATSLPVVITVTGIQQLDMETMSVYPNPNSEGKWNLSVSNGWLNGICEVYDAAGRLVYQTVIKAQNSEINMNVANAVYLMRVTAKGKTVTQKLINE